MYASAIAAISGVASMISSASRPASGQPRITRGVSPQASVVVRPTDSRASQIAGTFSISTQCSWMFCRSVTSAVPRAYRREMSAMARSCSVVELAAVDPDPQHEVAVVEFLRLEHRGLAAVDAGPALGVQPVPAEPAAQVGRVDRVEALLGVDVDDPLADVEPVVVLLVLLVLVQRLAVAEGPLALAALSSCLGPGRRATGIGEVPSGSGTRTARTLALLAVPSSARRAASPGREPAEALRAGVTAGRHPASRRARSVIRGGDHRVPRQMALRTRRRSTCRRTTSNGSVTLITTGSHVTDPAVQDRSGMWTVARTAAPCAWQQGRFARYSPAAPGSALADPAERSARIPDGADSAGGWCWQSHQVPPGQSS